MATEPNRIMLEPTAAAAAAAAAAARSLSKRHLHQHQHQQQLSGGGGGGGGVEEEKEEILFVDSTDMQNMDQTHRHPTLAGFVQNNFQSQHGGGAGEREQDTTRAQDVGDENGFRAQLESVSRFLFGSCGSAVETAASFFVQEHSGTCGRVGVHPHRGPGGVAAAAGLMGVRRASHHDMQQQQQQQQQQHLHPTQQQHYHSQHQQQLHAKPALSIADELRQLAIAEGRNPNAPVLLQQPPRSTDIPKFLGEDAVHSIDDDNISAISQHTLEDMDMARRGYNVQHHVHPMCVNVNGSSTSSRDRQEIQESAVSNSSNNNNNDNIYDHNSYNDNIQQDVVVVVTEEPPLSTARTRSLSPNSSCKDRRRRKSTAPAGKSSN